MLEKAVALLVEPRQGRQWHAGQAGPGAPTGCNMEAAALRVEDSCNGNEAALLKMMAVGAVALRVEPRQGKEGR